MKNYISLEESLFRNLDAFEIDFVPEIFNFREAQLKDIVSAIQPGMQGNRPINLVLRGLPGTGKTTAVRQIFSQIRTSTQRIIPVYINCQAEGSKYAVLAKIYAGLHKHQPPAKGVTVRQLIEDLGKTLMEREAVLLVCFDDANYLLPGNLLNNILYLLLRLGEEFPKARVGVILPMCNMDVDLRQALDPCVISVLQSDEVYFPPYREDEIGEILHDRIKAGLAPGVISNEIFSFIVDHTMRSGDIRVGLDLVKRSVMAAERDGRPVVTKEDVMTSFRDSGYVHMEAAIRALSTEDRKIVGHIAGLSIGDQPFLTPGEIFEFVNLSMQISQSGLSERLRKFADMGLLEFCQLIGNGRVQAIALRYDPVRVASACLG
ncbi:MAG: ORC1-type DNA replication protein [Methanomicrobiales archaeon]|nr:ORC1-type DNA replication protein [Methanomicrobiales archaeon]